MSGSAVAFSRTWAVGAYRATLSCPEPRNGEALSAVIEWEPHVPQRLTPAEVQAYRAGRDSALRDLADEMRVRVGVLEL